KLAITDRVNVSGCAADVDHQQVAPALFCCRSLRTKECNLKHSHRRRQNYWDQSAEFIEALGMGDMVHKQFANLFACTFHGELSRSRHDVSSAPNFLTAVG